MSIKTKVLLILSFFFLLYVSIDSFIKRIVLLPAFVSLEHTGAREDMERCIRAIQREIHHLHLVCRDWASWDDTANFVVTGSNDYADANLVINSFTDNGINLIYLLDSRGQVVWGEIYGLDPLERIRLEDFPETRFPPGHPLIVSFPESIPAAQRMTSGIFRTERGPMLVAARPILSSENEGPSRGTFIMGRFLDARLIRTLKEQTQVDFEIFRNDPSSLPHDLDGILDRLTDQSPYWIRTEENGRISIHGRFKDVQGQPYLLIRAGIPSTITQTGNSALRLETLSELGLSLVMLITILLVMKRVVLNPLSLLTGRVLEIGETGNLSARMGMGRRDEIGTLAREFDRMLEKLEERAGELAGANEKLRADIERRIQAEERLGASEDRYRSFLKNFQGIAFRGDMELNPLFVHGSVEPITGWSEEDFLNGKARWDRLVHPEDLPPLLGELEKLRTIPTHLVKIVVRIVRKDGRIRWLETFIGNFLDETGAPMYVQGACYDVSDRIQAGETLRSSERYYRSLLHFMHEEILVIDREFRIVDANKPRLQLVSRSRDEVLGMPCFELFSVRGQEPVHPLDKAGMEEIFQTGLPGSCRFKFVDKAGAATWLDILLSPMRGEKDEISHVIMAMRDVTQEVELEKSLHQSQKLEAIGTLAGGIAHDFNNILMTVMLNTEFALRRASPDPSVRESLELSLEASRRARDLVEQILTFSRKSDPETIPLKVTPILQESLKILRASLPATIRIEQAFEAASDTVMAAPTHIHQVLINLATNGAHAMKDAGGTLTVSLQQLTLDPADASRIEKGLVPGDYLKLSVEDTGHGMAPEILDRIFEPFFTTKRPGEGTGMGLAVVHGIVKGMKGAVAVESRPEKGSAFHVFLPVARMQKKDLPMDSAPARQGSGRILVVDDNRFVVRSLENALRHFGYEVMGKTDSREAFTVFESDPDAFDLVITDQVMPGLNGTELAERMFAVRPDLPLILCSGYSDIVSRDYAAGLGIRKVLTKPISASDLARAVESLLQ